MGYRYHAADPNTRVLCYLQGHERTRVKLTRPWGVKRNPGLTAEFVITYDGYWWRIYALSLLGAIIEWTLTRNQRWHDPSGMFEWLRQFDWEYVQ